MILHEIIQDTFLNLFTYKATHNTTYQALRTDESELNFFWCVCNKTNDSQLNSFEGESRSNFDVLF